MEALHDIFQVLAYIAGIAFLIIGLEDFVFDMQFVRYLIRHRNRRHITVEQLKNTPEKLIAVFVPAWMEGGVVNRMAEYATKVLLYEKYEIFIGVYPNDPETSACVDKLALISPRIHKVMVPHDGPTSKADCLNWIYRAMRLREIPGEREYAIVALHDSEDILHPLTLKIYNFFVPRRLDMAQIPVFPLELPPSKYWVGNTYIDEFCEMHLKDVYAREALGGMIPSAGVGTAFGRKALEALESHNHGAPFAVGNLTEDYMSGVQLKREGMRTGFVNYPIDRLVRKKQADGSPASEHVVVEIVGVRENFPREFRAAVRQRARWILGISFQCWEQVGWQGGLAFRYTLYRDRRAPLVHMLNALGYVVCLYPLAEFLLVRSPWAGQIFLPPLFQTPTFLWKLALLDACLLFYRFFQKILCIRQVFGWQQALFSIPRFVVNNVINVWATLRALRLFWGYKIGGKPLAWQKTSHIFPGTTELAEYTKSIEDLLLEEGGITQENLDQVLASSDGVSAPLALLRLGLIDEPRYTKVWSRHSGWDTCVVNPAKVSLDLLAQFGEPESLEWNALPIGRKDGRIVVAFREPPSTDRMDEFARRMGSPLLPMLAMPSNLAAVRNLSYPRLLLQGARRASLSEAMEKELGFKKEDLEQALAARFTSRQNLLDIVVDLGLAELEPVRALWAKLLGCSECDMSVEVVDDQVFQRVGASFFGLHRMVPLQNSRVAIADLPHPSALKWLCEQMGRQPTIVTDLPRHVNLSSRMLSTSFDFEQVLIQSLVRRGVLKQERLQGLQKMRSLVSDPLDVFIQQTGMASEAQIQEAFIEIAQLPGAKPWKREEVIRLTALLQPGFSERTHCYVLQEEERCLTLGLTRLLSAQELVALYERFAGFPLFFVALKPEESASLRETLKQT